MNFRDQCVTCSVCAKSFIYTVSEQRKLYMASMEQDKSDVTPPTVAGEVAKISAPVVCSDCRLRDPETGRWSGQIKWYNSEKGYGFITKSNTDEIFFHRSQVINGSQVSLEEGATVSFEQISTDRGIEARQVRVESE